MEMAIVFVAGVVLTLLGTYVLYRWQRTSRRLGYQILSAERLTRFEPKPGDPLQVMVRRDLIDGPYSAEKEYIPIGSVWTFRVLLRNSGNTPIENQPILVQLDSKAKVIRCDADPSDVTSTRAVVLDVPEEHRNVARIALPYLNPGEELTVGIQSVDNATGDCRIVAAGPGLESYDMRKRVERLDYILFGSGLLLVVGGGVLLGVSDISWLGIPANVQKVLSLVLMGSGVIFIIFGQILARWLR